MELKELETKTKDQEKEIFRLQMRLDDYREKFRGYDQFGERIATCEAYDQAQDRRLDRMEQRINDLDRKVAENSVKDLLTEERQQNREQTKQISALMQMAKEEREYRKDIRSTIEKLRDAMTQADDSGLATAASQIVFNVEGGKGGDATGGNAEISDVNINDGDN